MRQRAGLGMLAAALVAGCGGGGNSGQDTTCSLTTSPKATVNGGAALLQPVSTACGGTLPLLTDFQIQLIEPVSFGATGSDVLARLGAAPATVAANGSWSIPSVPTCVPVGILAGMVETSRTTAGSATFQTLTGVLQSFAPGATSAQTTATAYAVPYPCLAAIATLVGATLPGDGLLLVPVLDAGSGFPGVTVELDKPAGHTVYYPNADFTALQVSTAAHGLAVIRHTVAGSPVQLNLTLGGTTWPKCATPTSTSCYVPAQGAVIPHAAFVAPVIHNGP
jgi:hypothetical protein